MELFEQINEALAGEELPYYIEKRTETLPDGTETTRLFKVSLSRSCYDIVELFPELAQEKLVQAQKEVKEIEEIITPNKEA